MKELFNQSFWEDAYTKFLDWTIAELPALLILVILLIVFLRLLKFSVKRLEKVILNRVKRGEGDVVEAEKRANTLLGIVSGIGIIVIWAMFLMIFFKKLGVDIGPILAGAGIIGLAVGFGAQELVRDFISGFFILLENQVRTGDVAIINGTGGLVERIDLRTITLRDFSGVVHIIQNGKINTMSNMTKEWSAMVFDIGVAYKENVTQVMEVMKQVGEELQADPDFKDLIIEPLEIFGLDKFADSALVIKARLKTKPIQQWSVGREFRKRLKEAFDKNNIEIPFPHTTVYWGEEINPLRLDLNQNEVKN
jgi:small conductance mechanosensitive channel